MKVLLLEAEESTVCF